MKMLDAFAGTMARKPLWSLLFALAFGYTAAVGLSNLRMETDYAVFFDESDDLVKAFERFQESYGREDTLYLMVDAGASETIFTEENLRVVHEVSEWAETVPHASRVVSIASYPLVDSFGNTLAIAPGFDFEDGRLKSRYAPSDLQERLLSEPDAVGRLISKDGSAAGIWISLSLREGRRQDDSEEAYREAVHEIGQLREAHPSLRFYLTGSVALDAAFAKANKQDLMSLFPITMVVILLGTAVLMRSFVCLLASAGAIAGGVISCLGFAGWAGIPLSSVSISAPTIVMILTVAEVVHLFVAYQKAGPMRFRKDRVEAAVRAIVRPATLTTLTTCAGLMTLLFSPIPPFRHLGLIAAFGVLAGWVFTFLLVPPAMYLCSPNRRHGNALQPALSWWASRFKGNALRKGAIPTAGLLICLGGFAFANELDDNYVEYFDKSFGFRTETEAIDAKLSGIYSLEYDLQAKDGNIHSTSYLGALADFANWLEQQPGVTTVASFIGPLSRVKRALEDLPASAPALPASAAEAERNAVLYEMSVPADFDFRSRIDRGEGKSRLTAFLSNMSIDDINTLDRRAAAWLSRHDYWAEVEGRAATGTSLLFSKLGAKNISSMAVGTAILFAVATLLMFGIFRSIPLGLACSVANIVPAMGTLGLWGLFVGQIGMGSAAVATVTLGIVIDDTIHFGYRFRKHLLAGASAEQAQARTLMEVGPAIAISTIVLVCGFLVLATSGFEVNAALGAMVAVTVTLALIFDLYVLPAVLRQAAEKRQIQESRRPARAV